MKNTNWFHAALLVTGLAAAVTARGHSADGLGSPRARALAEDRRTVKGITPDNLERRLTLGTPRGGANATVVAPGTTPDRLDRRLELGSPRGREAFGLMGGR